MNQNVSPLIYIGGSLLWCLAGFTALLWIESRISGLSVRQQLKKFRTESAENSFLFNRGSTGIMGWVVFWPIFVPLLYWYCHRIFKR